MYDPLEMTSPRLFGKPLHLLFAKKKVESEGRGSSEQSGE